MTNQKLNPGIDSSYMTTEKDRKGNEVNQGHSCMKCIGCMNALVPGRR